MPKNIKGGQLGLFENPACCEISKTFKEGPFGDFEKFTKNKRKKIFGQSHSAEKGKRVSLWVLLTFILLKDIRKN